MILVMMMKNKLRNKRHNCPAAWAHLLGAVSVGRSVGRVSFFRDLHRERASRAEKRTGRPLRYRHQISYGRQAEQPPFRQPLCLILSSCKMK